MPVVYNHIDYLVMLTELSLLQLCQNGIKVTVVCPGPIETSNNSGAKPVEKGSSEVFSFSNSSSFYLCKNSNWIYLFFTSFKPYVKHNINFKIEDSAKNDMTVVNNYYFVVLIYRHALYKNKENCFHHFMSTCKY